MKIIIEEQNPVTVCLKDGTVLFEYQPAALDDNFVKDSIMDAYK
ncbi:hypothetical protein [Bacillus xiapuensis]|uniref:Uncharacterized protein n=1 Tax=Bacillus xiapuensis TaxID=2014075 RepID=A0ABU6N8G5_9BACI|nr:hypothetical protein [Bacillus xiapuensis]